MTTTSTEPTAGTIGGMVSQLQGTGQPQSQGKQEQMVLVPAGFLGDILSGAAGTVGQAVGGYFGNAQVGQAVGNAAAPLLKLIPWSAAPQAPQASAPQAQPTQPQTQPQQGTQDQMVLVPAGFLGDILSGAAGTIGSAVGSVFGSAQTGQDIGNAAAPLLKLIPWSAAPHAPQASPPQAKHTQPQTQPQQGTQEQMVLVPAGFLGSLLGSVGGGALGGWVGGMLGNEDLGKTLGSTVGGLGGSILPFAVVPA